MCGFWMISTLSCLYHSKSLKIPENVIKSSKSGDTWCKWAIFEQFQFYLVYITLNPWKAPEMTTNRLKTGNIRCECTFLKIFSCLLRFVFLLDLDVFWQVTYFLSKTIISDPAWHLVPGSKQKKSENWKRFAIWLQTHDMRWKNHAKF